MVTIVSRFDPSKVLWQDDTRDNLSRANLCGVNLPEANLSRANLYEANLSKANLHGANLSEANLSEADLYSANLSGANLSEANLSRANLSRVNLSWANLYEANLYRANLYEANLFGANLHGAKILDQFGKEVTISHLITQIDRKNGGYRFHAFKLTCGGILIKAGCRTFNTTDAYRDHAQREYPGTTKAAETLAILAFIDTVSEL